MVEEEQDHNDGRGEQGRGDGLGRDRPHARGSRGPERDGLPRVLNGGEPGGDARRRGSAEEVFEEKHAVEKERPVQRTREFLFGFLGEKVSLLKMSHR